MNRAYILIGTNIDRRRNYLEALRRLTALGRICSMSSVYETDAIGNDAAPSYYNGIVLLKTRLSAHVLKHTLREIEIEMGRVWSKDRNAPRPIDLDIVLFNDDQIEDEELRIPDPLILERPFMARALAEINPDLVYPNTGQTLVEIARRWGSHPNGMRLDPVMTRDAKNAMNADMSLLTHSLAR